MSRDPEKVLKELQKFLDAHAEDTENEADVDALAERFFAEYNLKCKEQKESAPETADDYLDLAKQVTSKKKSVEYLHKALELEPDNLDARLQLILRTAEQPDERRLALQELLDAADKQMEKSGAFKEYAGEFWTAFETRPYMRVRYTYFDVLISCGMMRRAIDEGQRLLELCENDIRYTDLLRISCTSIRKNCAEVGAVVSGWQVRLRRNAAFLCQEAQANPSMFRTT